MLAYVGLLATQQGLEAVGAPQDGCVREWRLTQQSHQRLAPRTGTLDLCVEYEEAGAVAVRVREGGADIPALHDKAERLRWALSDSLSQLGRTTVDRR